MIRKRYPHVIVGVLFLCQNTGMFIQTNVNPLKKNTGDCVIRAISILTDKSWEFTYMEKERELIRQLMEAKQN